MFLNLNQSYDGHSFNTIAKWNDLCQEGRGQRAKGNIRTHHMKRQICGMQRGLRGKLFGCSPFTLELFL